MARKYFTLCVRYDGGPFTVEFGDYHRPTVEFEREDLVDHGTKRKDIRIIATGDRTADVEAGVAQLNRT